MLTKTNKIPQLPGYLWIGMLVLAQYIIGASAIAQSNASALKPLLTKEQVGATQLPETIAPVSAPFPMPVFKRPVFPALTISITEKGAKPGTIATKQIQAAIDEVSGRKGGSVIVPRGIWKSGRISLKSNVDLHFEDGAELHFSGNIEDYQPAVLTRNEGNDVMSLGACIYANGQENIAVTGKGRLVGPEDGPVRTRYMRRDVPTDKPVAQRVYAGHNGDSIYLPMFISPVNCRNVFIEGISLERTAFWNIVPVYCDGVIIRGITVNSVGIPRGDGIDIESTKNVLIEYCTLSCGDDCFTMKSGRGEDGLRVNRATENIVVRYCLAMKGHGGITCGSETAGMIRNLYVHDCVFDDTGVGIRFKTRRPRGGGGENLYYERIRMNLNSTAFNWDMLGGTMYVGDLALRLPARALNKLTPVYRNITARDILVEKSSQFIKVNGIPESPLANLLIENSEINCKGLITIADGTGITIKNTRVTSQDPVINLLDTRNLVFDKVQFNVPGKEVIVKTAGPLTEKIVFKNCMPEKPKDWPTTSWMKP